MIVLLLLYHISDVSQNLNGLVSNLLIWIVEHLIQQGKERLSSPVIAFLSVLLSDVVNQRDELI